MLKTLHPSDDMDRIYESRKGGRRGLASIENYIDKSILELGKFTKTSKESLITATCNSYDNIKTKRHKKIEMDMGTSRDKIATLLKKKLGHGLERETGREKLRLY